MTPFETLLAADDTARAARKANLAAVYAKYAAATKDAP